MISHDYYGMGPGGGAGKITTKLLDRKKQGVGSWGEKRKK